jgi:hypothetical protein
VAAPAGQTLEALVRDELRGPIAELVLRLAPELVAEQLNGAEFFASERANPADTKLCTVCGETKPLDAFESGRRTCKRCRSRAGRRRVVEPEAVPFDGSQSPSLPSAPIAGSSG